MIRAAIVGLGHHGFRHIEAVKKINDIVIVAVCDFSVDKLNKAKTLLPNVSLYKDFEKLLHKENVDLLSIVTNGPSHANIALKGINKGIKYIFCEKPICTSVTDAKSIIEACEKNKVRFIIGYIRRFSEDYKQLVKIIKNGIIGKPRHFHVTVGSGLFAAVGTHYLDLMRMIGDTEPIKVFGYLGKQDRPNPRGIEFKDPGAFGVFMFKNGSRGVIDIIEDIGITPKFEVVGSIGRIIIEGDEESGAKWTLYSRNRKLKSESLSRYDIKLECKELGNKKFSIIDLLTKGYRELISNDDLSCNAIDGLKNLEMLLAVHICNNSRENIIDLPLNKKLENYTVNFT